MRGVTANNQAFNETYALYDVLELTLPEGDELDKLIEEQSMGEDDVLGHHLLDCINIVLTSHVSHLLLRYYSLQFSPIECAVLGAFVFLGRQHNGRPTHRKQSRVNRI